MSQWLLIVGWLFNDSFGHLVVIFLVGFNNNTFCTTVHLYSLVCIVHIRISVTEHWTSNIVIFPSNVSQLKELSWKLKDSYWPWLWTLNLSGFIAMFALSWRLISTRSPTAGSSSVAPPNVSMSSPPGAARTAKDRVRSTSIWTRLPRGRSGISSQISWLKLKRKYWVLFVRSLEN